MNRTMKTTTSTNTVTNAHYLVVYWCSLGPSRRALGFHSHEDLTSARRELGRRGYRLIDGSALKGQAEEYTRTGDGGISAASINQLRACRTIEPVE